MSKNNSPKSTKARVRPGTPVGLADPTKPAWETIPETGGKPFEIREASLDEILQLRYDVLIKGTHRITRYFPGDYDRDTWHVGAFQDGTTVGCLTLLLNAFEGEEAWQLRGNAVHPKYRSHGIGRALMEYVEKVLLEDSEVRLLWCNARESAVPFYERFGWERTSGPFEIPGVGTHYKMKKRL